MSEKARIRTDFPTEEEIAAQLKLSAGRVAELRKQLYDLHITNADGTTTIVEIKNGRARAKTAPAQKLMKPSRLRAAKRR